MRYGIARNAQLWAAAVVLFTCAFLGSAKADVLYFESWASAYTADVSVANFGWGTFTANAALNTASTAGINTANASFPRLGQTNVATPYPDAIIGMATTTPELTRGYMYVGQQPTNPQFQWTNEY